MSEQFQNPQHSPGSQSGQTGQSAPPAAPSPRTTLTNLSAAEGPNPRTTLSGMKAAETPQSLAAQMLPEDEISRRVREADGCDQPFGCGKCGIRHVMRMVHFGLLSNMFILVHTRKSWV